MTRGRKKKPVETEKKKADDATAETDSGKTPDGPDRILVFADSLAGDSEGEEKRDQKLETW